jgi:alpha,alpha-trehalase
MWAKEYKDCLAYIDTYWKRIIFKPSPMKLPHRILTKPFRLKTNSSTTHFINIPHPYFVPNDRKFKYIFYWDSYFMFAALRDTKRQHLMKHQVDNFLYLFKKYQIIPNFNAPASMGRSQPPFLTSMIRDAYHGETDRNLAAVYKRMPPSIRKPKMDHWLKEAIEIAKKEYEIVWIDKEKLYNHSVDGYELSRYGDRDVGYAHSSELESGWDMTSRFFNRCDQFLPVDLNSYLYKYEKDFEVVADMFGEKKEAKDWQKKAEKRKEVINTLMWNEKEGFFFDYGYFYKQQSTFYSLAGFAPLWARLATDEQAAKVVKQIEKFETPYGLTITTQDSLARPIDLSTIQKRYHPALEEIIKSKQWDYPNIWSPLEYITVEGLLNYGYKKEAKRIMEKSVKAHAGLYRKYGTFFEKINAETGEPAASFHYAGQDGFGWTNAVFFHYIRLLDSL